MKQITLTFLVFSALWSAPCSAKNETIILSEEHRIGIAVPDGYEYSSRRNEQGAIGVQLVDPGQKISLQVVFLPDPKGEIVGETGQKDFLAGVCQPYAEGSVERSYDFKPLESRGTSGLYCHFTDATLAHSDKPPPAGEYLHVTSGVKVWSGYFLLFTLLSNDTTSKEYRTAFKLLQNSFDEKKPAGPLL